MRDVHHPDMNFFHAQLCITRENACAIIMTKTINQVSAKLLRSTEADYYHLDAGGMVVEVEHMRGRWRRRPSDDGGGRLRVVLVAGDI
jgi:hypothetical protein